MFYVQGQVNFLTNVTKIFSDEIKNLLSSLNVKEKFALTSQNKVSLFLTNHLRENKNKKTVRLLR